MDRYDLTVAVLGIAFLAAVLLPRVLRNSPLSLPLVYVAAGLLLPLLWGRAPRVDPLEHGVFTERLAELAVIISLMSAGLKIDRPLGWRSWNSTWRLLAVTMPLCIAALTLGGMWLLGLPLAAAVLLGAVLAPTDPVLASSVQIGPPGSGGEDEARFALTSEAGLNDGLAFPFVNLAIVLAAVGLAQEGLAQWALVDVAWKVAAGVVVGGLVGHGVATLVFRHAKAEPVTDGFLALALTLLVYGLAELAHGYGFLGVFAAALWFRHCERDHEYHRALHDFAEQIERLLMAVLLLLFGAAITHGLLAPLGWQGVLLGLLFLLLVRPAAALVGLVGGGVPRLHGAVISFYGIRGIGTFYYLAHALNEAEFAEPHARAIWAVAGFVVVASIVLHGTTAPYAISRVKQ